MVINRLYSAGISRAHRGRPVTDRTARSKPFVLSGEGDVDSFMMHFAFFPLLDEIGLSSIIEKEQLFRGRLKVKKSAGKIQSLHGQIQMHCGMLSE